MPSYTATQLARRVGAEIEGDPDRRVRDVAPLDAAAPSDLAFFARDSMRRRLEETEAGVVLVSSDAAVDATQRTLLRVDDPHVAFSELVGLFRPPPIEPSGIHPTVQLGPGVELGDDVTLCAHVVVGAGAVIGSGTRVGISSLIGPGASVGRDCRIGDHVSILHGVRIGDRVILHPGARVGTDGYGYAPTARGARKVPQVGGCVLEEDVEVGANCTIDRGALGDTTIGARTKIDNLVHVGHNVRIGHDCMIVAQVGIAGSTEVGPGSALAGQVGVGDHLSLGAGVRIGGGSGVTGNVPAGATFTGYPAQPHTRWKRQMAALRKLPGLLRRLRVVERHLGIEHSSADRRTERDGLA